jgi:dihydrofolate reductase
MIVSIIVAMSENHVIAKDGKMPWHLPDEFKHFKETTLGHHIIMGRKTYESLGKALAGRRNVVLTRRANPASDENRTKSGVVEIYPDAVSVQSLRQALDYAESQNEDEAFIIGGGQVYKQAMELADRLYLTVVHHPFDGDVFFPAIDYDEWLVTREKHHPVDARHKYAYTVYTMERKHLA